MNEEKEMSKTWKSNANARIWSEIMKNEILKTSIREIEISKTIIKEKKHREYDNQMSISLVIRISKTEMNKEEREISRI